MFSRSASNPADSAASVPPVYKPRIACPPPRKACLTPPTAPAAEAGQDARPVKRAGEPDVFIAGDRRRIAEKYANTGFALRHGGDDLQTHRFGGRFRNKGQHLALRILVSISSAVCALIPPTSALRSGRRPRPIAWLILRRRGQSARPAPEYRCRTRQ